MTNLARQLAQKWLERLSETEVNRQQRQEILQWLLEKSSQLATMSPEQLAVFERGMEYRYRILQERYLNVSPTRAYENLITRLSSVALLRQKISGWIAGSCNPSCAVAEVVQEAVAEMIKRDRYIQGQINLIAQCTKNPRLRNALLLTNLEEYCLRPIRNQPLITYRFYNLLRRQRRGGITQIPRSQTVRLISEDLRPDENDSGVSLIDREVALNQPDHNWQERQRLRLEVQQKFEAYLAENLGILSLRWLELYLQGHSPEEIATVLEISTKQVYRLREKVRYHALRVFALKEKPELVAGWLETTLSEHDLGLTPKQWDQYWHSLTPKQQKLVNALKAGHSLETLAQEWHCTTRQLTNQWSQVYLAAQAIRRVSAQRN